MTWTKVSHVAQLSEALAFGSQKIEVSGVIRGIPSLTLSPGVCLRGGELVFGAKGLKLTSNNTLTDVAVRTSPHEMAIYNDPTVADLGTLRLRNVTTHGHIYLSMEGNIRAGRVEANAVHVVEADTRGRTDRPAGFGVEAMQGAFTLWNRQAEGAAVLTAGLENISAGSAGSPVRGGGVFVGGHGNTAGISDGGTVELELLNTGDVNSDGGIAPGTPDLISGGVFIISGTRAEQVLNFGTTTTYGQNDMVLDNWGEVAFWTALGNVTSHGPSGIGFVNFGPIKTTGLGVRGFNVSDGSLNEAAFESITITGDGSVGVQVSRELPKLTSTGNLSIAGGTGESLVKGVLMPLSAIALNVKPSGHIVAVSVSGDVSTAGDGLITVNLEGPIGSLEVGGKVIARGNEATASQASAGNAPALEAVVLEAPHGGTTSVT